VSQNGLGRAPLTQGTEFRDGLELAPAQNGALNDESKNKNTPKKVKKKREFVRVQQKMSLSQECLSVARTDLVEKCLVLPNVFGGQSVSTERQQLLHFCLQEGIRAL
jgi:hypothetical protein